MVCFAGVVDQLNVLPTTVEQGNVVSCINDQELLVVMRVSYSSIIFGDLPLGCRCVSR